MFYHYHLRETTINFMLLLGIIAVISYVLIHAIEIASFGSRVAGRITSRVALGTTLSQTIYTASRFILILFLPTLGFLVESGINLNEYLILVISAYILTFLVSIIMILKLNALQIFFQIVFSKYANNTIPVAILKSLFNKNTELNQDVCASFTFDKLILKKTLVSFSAYIFLITGFFIAFMLAVLFPENRLTLSQFTAAFHGFGAIIFAFYLDPMLSRSIDSYSDDVSWLQNIYSILVGRALSYLIMIIFLFIYFLL
tara:strand:+ start:1545 stop:2315 length:771 start_codon:yes stop_codon:yes gene_type:complete